MLLPRTYQSILGVLACLSLALSAPLHAEKAHAPKEVRSHAADSTDSVAPVQSKVVKLPEADKPCCQERRNAKKERAKNKKEQKKAAKPEKPAKKKEPKKEKPKKEPKEKPVKKEEKPTSVILEQLYTGVSGYGIPQTEVEMIKSKGGAPTYGEIIPKTWKSILDDLPKKSKKGSFYDFGCGVGKVVIQAYLDAPTFKKAIGWELSNQRYDDAMIVKAKMKEQGLLDPKRPLEFYQGDFLEAKIDDATVIYMCSTCYSDECMQQLVDKFSKLKKGLIVITLKRLPNYEKAGFELIQEYHNQKMTWSDTTPVYVYELTKPVKEKEIIKEKDPKKDKKSKKEPK